MDFFRLLARGAQLDSTDAFAKSEAPVVEDKEYAARDLDFFHTRTAPAITETKHLYKKRKIEESDAFAPTPTPTAAQRRKAKITGADVPHPLTAFADLAARFDVSEDLLRAVGFEMPTQIQAEVIPAILHRRDVLACAPTGSGKTLAYVLPILHAVLQQETKTKGGIAALIIVPTKELATQVAELFTVLMRRRSKEVKVNVLSKSLLARLGGDEHAASPGEVLISTPLRLIRALALVKFTALRYLVLDEADKLFDIAFATQTGQILTHIAAAEISVQKTFLSATMPSSVETISLGLMSDPLRILISPGRAAESVTQKLVYTGSEAGKLLAIRQMIKVGEMTPPVLIFLQSVERANALMHELIYDGLNVDVIHGDRTETQRRAIVEKFKKAQIWVLICTDVFARGIDVHGVNLVINYDVPENAQAYIHRIGRTGRAGKTGTAVTFFTKEDAESVKTVVNVMKASGCAVEEWMSNLGKVDKRKKSKSKIRSKITNKITK
ncbi:P-loop containing nucleoside triphosphate hydrolase protein [Limtongia smithiae]|uniref:P-loop containing nucleoside triphosphate hydrolase protein n=1 Tax=Limtongia smithiae TaxID=1125753 RepID=UPI0034D0185A